MKNGLDLRDHSLTINAKLKSQINKCTFIYFFQEREKQYKQNIGPDLTPAEWQKVRKHGLNWEGKAL